MARKPLAIRDRTPYEVGYGKPPALTRFKKGVSGNPSGRPTTPMTLNSVLKNELDTLINIAVGGKSRQVSKREAIVRRLFAKALRGDVRALEIFLRHMRKNDTADSEPPYVVKFYKDDLARSQPTRDGKDAGETSDSDSSLRTGDTYTAIQRAGCNSTTSESSRNPQAGRND